MILIVSADPVPILLLPEKQGNFHLNSLDDSAIKGFFFAGAFLSSEAINIFKYFWKNSIYNQYFRSKMM